MLVVMHVDSCIQTPAPLVTSEGKLLNFSVPQCPHLKMVFKITNNEIAMQV